MLYIISSPIGNMSDLSERAIETLKKVNYIVCEDTRETLKILKRFAISKKVVSFHEHSSSEKIKDYIEDLLNGYSIAYLSDSGTPNLSDPGGRLVEQVMLNDIKVSPIPGPSALTSLISVAPFNCSEFEFIGFFPKKKGREKMAKRFALTKNPIFFFESPKRIHKTILFLAERLPTKKLLYGRELTKIYEEIKVLDLSKLNTDNIKNIPQRGEFVLAIFE